MRIRLDANEAPALLPTLNAAEKELLASTLLSIEPARYPDARATPLRAAIAEKTGVGVDQIVLGVGSDEVISILLGAFKKSPDRAPAVLVPTPTFVMYRATSRVHGYDVVDCPLDADFDLDLPAMLSAIESRKPAVVWLATPNNPTAGVYSRDRVQAIIHTCVNASPPIFVVVDEAYLPFRFGPQDPWHGKTAVDWLAEFPNVIGLRTLSKIGLAAARVGWSMAHPSIAYEMDKVRQPFNHPTYSQAVATLMLTKLWPAIDRHIASIVAERARLVDAVRRIDSLKVHRTDSNFLWIESTAISGTELASRLKAREILVRDFRTHPTFIRVTVGSPQENAELIDLLPQLVRGV
jgi:histidinol-phosphate aminotransferase